MIATDKDLAEKALLGAKFLRQHAEHMASSPSLMDRIAAEPRELAANAIEVLVKENTELRAQLVAFQKAANPAVAVDPAAPDGERTCYTTFVKGLRVCLRHAPSTRGTIDDTRFDKNFGHLVFVCFESSSEPDRWVAVDLLELVPRPDK
ncbi:hypothetical protein J9R26_000635 [Salmonella enterica]|nr:hypothetical protein [Salmonella enterica]EHI6359496.1 hypothetical protein [Salmonella enterica]EHI9810689.1 hypothetical protein [Salmonella enterica]